MNDQPRKLVRDPDNKMIAGVAAGVANFFGIDPTIVRIIWAFTILLGGLGIIVYIVMWIVVPEGDSDRTVAHDLRDAAAGASDAEADTSPGAENDTDDGEDTSTQP